MSRLYTSGRAYPTSTSPYRIVLGRFGTWDCGKEIVYGPHPHTGNIKRLYTFEKTEPPILTVEQWIDANIARAKGGAV